MITSFIKEDQQLVPQKTSVIWGMELRSLLHGLHGLHCLHRCLLPHHLHGWCCSCCLHGPALHCCLLPHHLHGWCRRRCLHGPALHCCLLLHDLHGLHCLHGLRHCWKREGLGILEAHRLQLAHL